MFRRLAGHSVPPPPPPPGLLEQLALLLKVELLPFWLFWQNLRAMRGWWPLLVPLLFVYGRRAYRRERAARLERQASATAEQGEE
jgi:hypothetical protein